MEKFNNRCSRCGKFVKRGILNQVQHLEKCGPIKTYNAALPKLKNSSLGIIFFTGSEGADKFKKNMGRW